VDPATKKKDVYQARVYTGKILLQSAFWPSTVNTVICSIWFQDDLPYPGVDLTKLKPKLSDSYPISLIDGIKKNNYVNKYKKILELNFGELIDI
jgi:hypothetical protein